MNHNLYSELHNDIDRIKKMTEDMRVTFQAEQLAYELQKQKNLKY